MLSIISSERYWWMSNVNVNQGQRLLRTDRAWISGIPQRGAKWSIFAGIFSRTPSTWTYLHIICVINWSVNVETVRRVNRREFTRWLAHDWEKVGETTSVSKSDCRHAHAYSCILLTLVLNFRGASGPISWSTLVNRWHRLNWRRGEDKESESWKVSCGRIGSRAVDNCPQFVHNLVHRMRIALLNKRLAQIIFMFFIVIYIYISYILYL